MIAAPDKRTVMFDVDDTLIMWECKHTDDDAMFIPGPHGEHGIHVRPHLKHIHVLKNLKGIGWYVVVWSQGGADHAANVIKHLELEKYVDLVISKPEVYFDDLPFEQQGIARRYQDE